MNHIIWRCIQSLKSENKINTTASRISLLPKKRLERGYSSTTIAEIRNKDARNGKIRNKNARNGRIRNKEYGLRSMGKRSISQARKRIAHLSTQIEG